MLFCLVSFQETMDIRWGLAVVPSSPSTPRLFSITAITNYHKLSLTDKLLISFVWVCSPTRASGRGQGASRGLPWLPSGGLEKRPRPGSCRLSGDLSSLPSQNEVPTSPWLSDGLAARPRTSPSAAGAAAALHPCHASSLLHFLLPSLSQ